MISDALEQILQDLYADARARSYEMITLEQLLLRAYGCIRPKCSRRSKPCT